MPEHTSSVAPTEDQHPASLEDDDVHAHWQRVAGRRSFLKGVGLVAAAATTLLELIPMLVLFELSIIVATVLERRSRR